MYVYLCVGYDYLVMIIAENKPFPRENWISSHHQAVQPLKTESPCIYPSNKNNSQWYFVSFFFGTHKSAGIVVPDSLGVSKGLQ